MTDNILSCLESADPRLLGALCRTGGGGEGGGWDERMDAMHLSVFHSVSNRDRGKRSSLPRLQAFNSFFFFSNKETVHVNDSTDFDAEIDKINDHLCFHILWPNSKTKLTLKHFWEQGVTLVFRGPMQLAYSTYREDRLCAWIMFYKRFGGFLKFSMFLQKAGRPTFFFNCILKYNNLVATFYKWVKHLFWKRSIERNKMEQDNLLILPPCKIWMENNCSECCYFLSALQF